MNYFSERRFMSTEMLQKLAEKFGLMLDWSSSTAIPYLQQLAERVVRFEVGQSIFWMIIGIIFIIVGIGLFVFVYKKCKAEEYFDEEILFWISLVGVICIVASVIIVGCQVYDLVTCYYLPEKILFRYVSK